MVSVFIVQYSVLSQFSPGKLMKAHSKLEGSSNCTKCHDLGNKVTDKKCLDCHKEISTLIYQKRGYHGNSAVKSKSCISCHSDHHGSEFDAIRFDEKNFNHNNTGYELEGKHKYTDCRECHKSSNISDSKIKKRYKTYLGLQSKCTSCHADYHQETLSQTCTKCHTMNDFKKASNFDHNKTKYPLKGAHTRVDCKECHAITTRNNKEFQVFADVKHANCTNCHKDQHNGQFGTNCTKCHNNESWTSFSSGIGFNHDETRFPLKGKHVSVACDKCHKNGDFSQKIKFTNCSDCHIDYHDGELKLASETVTDCKRCHSVEYAFTYSSFSIKDHEKSKFPLKDAHVATPCFSCHKTTKDKRWNFKFNTQKCVECHVDIHKNIISEKFYPDQKCQSCHNENAWSDVKFDHSTTNFKLSGKHQTVSCRECHFEKNSSNNNLIKQVFVGLNKECVSCHTNSHGNQFEINGVTDCKSCHKSDLDWKIFNFDHENTNFSLSGAHEKVSCSECHKPTIQSDGKTIVLYKIKKYKCIDCHY